VAPAMAEKVSTGCSHEAGTKVGAAKWKMRSGATSATARRSDSGSSRSPWTSSTPGSGGSGGRRTSPTTS
jgi:hypothetical protein